MATYLLAAVIFSAAGYILYGIFVQKKSSCSDCSDNYCPVKPKEETLDKKIH